MAAALTATHPGLVVYAARIHQPNLDAPLFAAAILLVVRQGRLRSLAASAALGVVSGIALLSRPTFAVAVVGGSR